MKDEQRIKTLEEELKVLKNEIKTVLLDLREQQLNAENPFNSNALAGTGSRITSVNAERREIEAEMENYEAESNAEADVVITPTDMEKIGEQTNTFESPTMLLATEKPSEHKIAQDEVVDTPRTDISGIDNSIISAQDDMPGCWQEAEECSEEEFSNEPQQPKAILPNKRKKEQASSTLNSKVDLVVIAGLTQWIDQTTAKLGKERTEVLIEISSAMGRLPENLKDALIRMSRLSQHETVNRQSITAGDYLSILAQLENLITGSKQQDNALLSILSMMQDSHHG